MEPILFHFIYTVSKQHESHHETTLAQFFATQGSFYERGTEIKEVTTFMTAAF